MHIVTDENGNPVPHGHDASCHEHEHCHAQENGCPGHEHHAHEGHHHHLHDHAEPQTKDQMAALLDYMAKHNEQHAAELDRMAAKLAENGRADAAEHVRKAVDEFQKGNLYLNLALSMVREQ